MKLTLAVKVATAVLAALCIIWSSSSGASALQVGASATGPSSVTTTRASIGEPHNRVNGTYNLVYWEGVTFKNGDFFQAGYLDASSQEKDLCQTGLSSFVTGLTPSGNSLFPNLYNNGHCGLTGTHYFELEVVGTTQTSVRFRWYLSGTAIGPTLTLPRQYATFTKDAVGVVTELVDAQTAPASAEFPTEEYKPAIQFISGTTFADAEHGNFIASTDRTCYYALKAPGVDQVTTGEESHLNPSSCHNPGSPLW